MSLTDADRREIELTLARGYFRIHVRDDTGNAREICTCCRTAYPCVIRQWAREIRDKWSARSPEAAPVITED